jgi:hypothetical protein
LKRSIIAPLLASSISVSAMTFDQPEVTFSVERWSEGRVAECPVMIGSLGDRLETDLANQMKVAALSGPLDQDGRTELNIRIYSASGALLHEKNYSAKLSQQKPSFQFGGVTVLVASESLLKTTRGTTWRDFDTRMKPNKPLERTNSQQDCVPLLGAAQRSR